MSRSRLLEKVEALLESVRKLERMFEAEAPYVKWRIGKGIAAIIHRLPDGTEAMPIEITKNCYDSPVIRGIIEDAYRKNYDMIVKMYGE